MQQGFTSNRSNRSDRGAVWTMLAGMPAVLLQEAWLPKVIQSRPTEFPHSHHGMQKSDAHTESLHGSPIANSMGQALSCLTYQLASRECNCNREAVCEDHNDCGKGLFCGSLLDVPTGSRSHNASNTCQVAGCSLSLPACFCSLLHQDVHP